MPGSAALAVNGGGRSRYQPWIALGCGVGVIALLRMVVAAVLPLAPDEAYYWTWSGDLAASYPDHPPLVAWLIRAGTALLGDSRLGVRLVTILLGAAGTIVCYRIARAVPLPRWSAVGAALLGNLLPISAVGSLLATPDSPLGLCGLLAVLALLRLRSNGLARYWYLLGAATGVALLAKLSGLLIPALSLIVVVRSPRLRRQLRGLHPWAAAALALLVALPHVVAMAGEGFPSVRFQLAHLLGELPAGGGAPLPSTIERIGGLLGGQIALLTPLVAWFALIGAWRSRLADGVTSVLTIWLLAPMVVTLVSAFFTHPEQGWASLGHPLAAILAFAALGSREPDDAGRRRVWLAALAVSALAVTALIHLHALERLLPLPPKRDPVSRLYGWEAPHKRIVDLIESENIDAVICDNYGLAAMVEWQRRRRGLAVPLVCGTDRPCAAPGGRWLILDQRDDWGNARVVDGCAGRRTLAPIVHTHRGEELRRIDLAIGEGCPAKP